jgi:DNA adenine methylase
MLKNYPGSKGANGAWQQIISQIPKCHTFIEVMAGSGFISSKMTDSTGLVVVNDIDRSVIDQFDFTAGNIVKENLHYRCIIDKYDQQDPGTVFYFDPPYLMSTRSHKAKIYRHEWDDQDHHTFLAMASTVKSNCLISHYPCELYDTELSAWRKITYNSMTRAGVRTEALYMNFPAPALLANHDYVGKNYTDRQRIKRKVKRLTDRLQNETDTDRAAILSAVIEHFSYVTRPHS